VGLSLGEIETINNIFNGYEVIESELQKDSDYASTLEVEFIKNIHDEFFNCISIDKWNVFVEVVKNIKKRRGNKGLKLRLIITDYFEETQYRDEDIVDINGKGDKIELLFFRRMIFLLGHKNHNEFIKGLERIEIAIENIAELSHQTKKFYYLIKESQFNTQIDREGFVHDQETNQQKHRHYEANIQLYIFIFDFDKRIWKTL
jgi:hypothetical protein